MAQDDKGLLGRLNEHGVEFVIVGGVCGTLHGVSLVTKEIDALIESKSAVGRDQDVMAVKQLRAIKERNEPRKS